MRKKGKAKTFIFGAGIGALLGLLFAPKKGSELRAEVKESFFELMDKIKELDLGETKENFTRKLEEIKDALSEFDAAEVKKIAFEKAELLKEKVADLYVLAIEKGIPQLRESTEDLMVKVNDLAAEISKRFNEEKVLETKTTVKKPNEKITVKRTKTAPKNKTNKEGQK